MSQAHILSPDTFQSGASPQVGSLLRAWREHRRRTQLDLALDAGVSTRHLSFLETGRARPSREMLLHLAEELAVPLRARNALLLAAGYAPAFPERSFDDPGMTGARAAIAQILAAHDPNPALVVDRGWRLLAANRAVFALVAGAAPALLTPPVNVLRLSLHPDGLGGRIVNYAEWRTHIVERLHSQQAAAPDAALPALIAELEAYPTPPAAERDTAPADLGGLAVPFRLRTEAGVLSFLSATTLFGGPRDVTLAELALETFLPADAETADAMRRLGFGPRLTVASRRSNTLKSSSHNAVFVAFASDLIHGSRTIPLRGSRGGL